MVFLRPRIGFVIFAIQKRKVFPDKMMRYLIFILSVFTTMAYAQSGFKRFAGTITVVTDEAIKYDNELLLLYHIDPKLKPIFEWGLLYPGLFRTAATENKSDIAHKITISEFKILPSATPKIKTFQFVVLYNDGSPPRLYHLELANQAGNWKMDIHTFVRKSHVAQLRAK